LRIVGLIPKPDLHCTGGSGIPWSLQPRDIEKRNDYQNPGTIENSSLHENSENRKIKKRRIRQSMKMLYPCNFKVNADKQRTLEPE